MAVKWRHAARRTGYVGSLALVFGVCAGLAGGAGLALADSPADGSPTGATSQDSTSSSNTGASTQRESHEGGRDAPDASPQALPRLNARMSEPLSHRDSRFRADERTGPHRPGARSASEPAAAVDLVEPAEAEAAPAPVTPSPGDAVSTDYGDVGKWMLKHNGQIADWGGKRYRGKALLESVNVVIVDPHSTTPKQAARAVNDAMLRSGFPAQYLHSFGFRARIDGVTYGQKPTGPLLSYSNNFFLFPNDHGRLFGPAPTQTDAGYVWTGAFSTEKVGFSGLLPGHVYVSSNQARDALVQQLVSSGQATYGGLVPLENAYNTASTTTGDHDGFAVVLVLTGNAPLVRREAVLGELPRSAAETPDRRCAAGTGAAVQRTQSLGPLTVCGAGRPISI